MAMGNKIVLVMEDRCIMLLPERKKTPPYLRVNILFEHTPLHLYERRSQRKSQYDHENEQMREGDFFTIYQREFGSV